MLLLPVMDLQDGQVVRAVAGQRSAYRPLRSCLTASTAPAAVARALLGLAPFAGLYVADLEAIVRGGDRHFDRLVEVCGVLAEAGACELWLDAGRAPWLAELAKAAPPGVQLVPVIGSESLMPDEWPDLHARFPSAVLSLDYKAGEFLGPTRLDQHPEQWPRRVIVMELAVVGVGGGPALARLDRLSAAARQAGRGDIEFLAAGGVRGLADLHTLAARGARGALLASALHDGALDAAALASALDA